MTSVRAAAAGILALSLAACGRGTQQAASPTAACRQVEGPLAADADVAGMVGRHRILMVATDGPRTGDSAAGHLSLVEHADSMRQTGRSGVLAPFYGAVDLDLEAVGALEPGTTTSMDPSRPGAAVFDWQGPGERQVTVRLGSNANRRDRVLFDGAYTVLRLTWIDGARFGGTWSSGTTQPEGAGYFCAEPVEE